MTRVLITGSRSWKDRAVLVDALDELLAKHGILTVVHGGAPGADRMARAWVITTPSGDGFVTEEPHPADWQRYGKRAGMVRNIEMIKAGADVCIAFIRDRSPGATHCARMAGLAGIPVIRYEHGSTT